MIFVDRQGVDTNLRSLLRSAPRATKAPQLSPSDLHLGAATGSSLMLNRPQVAACRAKIDHFAQLRNDGCHSK